jgi:hypothetical protein
LKAITNWRNATVFDAESDGFLDVATKLHVLSYQMQMKGVSSFNAALQTERIKALFIWHMDNKVPVVAHNGICFDIPLIEKLLGLDLTNLMVIDTLAISWYLNPERNLHGLDSFHEDYGIAKPKVQDWDNQPYEVYENRCQEDVKINKALWEDLKSRLIDMYSRAKVEIDLGKVGGKRMFPTEVIYIDQYKGSTVDEAIDRILTFLMFKMDCARLQERTQWEADVVSLTASQEKLSKIVLEAKAKLESVMPKVPKYTLKKKPADPYKMSGDLSVHGEKWFKVLAQFEAKEVDDLGNLMVKESNKPNELKTLKEYEPPSASSPLQIKSFLFSKGWVPLTFKYEKDEELFAAWVASKPKEGAQRGSWTAWKAKKPPEREIPQVTKAGEDGKELCQSVLDLAEEIPEIMLYADYNVAKHRLGVVDGFLRDLRDGKWLQARIGGFTNTLRVQHRELVNLPGVDKAHGEDIRGGLIAGFKKILLGSDMSSLEDRIKINFMMTHDQVYVEQLSEKGYDPHLAMAVVAGMITEDEKEFYKWYKANH